MKTACRHISVLIVAIAALIPCSFAAAAPPKGWEPAKSEYATAKTVIKETEFEIKATSGTILVSCNHPIQIKIFTILGRLVSSETLAAGTSRLTLPAHGVYIVKVGDITCKVAV